MVHVHEAAGNPGRQESSKAKCCQCPPATPAWSTPFPPVGIQCHSSKTCRSTSTQLVCSFQSLLFNITVPVDRCNIVNGQKYLQDFLKSVTKCLFAMETQKVLVPTWRKRWSFLYVLVIQSQDASFPVWCQARTSGAPVTATFTPWNHFLTTRLSMPDAYLRVRTFFLQRPGCDGSGCNGIVIVSVKALTAPRTSCSELADSTSAVEIKSQAV